ncbi:hypothetical protein ACH5RR_035133 [Cinchona calisaya]|uniref:RING-type domain-containing protein n=1 Tax=Cinchona calisaya TaxID=153742 RepID=A0ABD2YHD7_9GENT
MACSLTELPPPLSCISIVAIIIVYVIICYLVIDLIDQNENRSEKNCSGLSPEGLQAMNCFYYHKVGSESICAICLDSLQNSHICRAFPPCGHIFHCQCIDPWLANNLTCPTCRASFGVELHLYS